MKVNYFDAEKNISLEKNLYIVTGKEPYQQNKIINFITSFYKKNIYEVCTHEIAQHNYDYLYQQNNALSLFSTKRFIKIIFNKSPDKAGQKAILENITNNNDNSEDVYLLVFSDISSSSIKTKWFQNLAVNSLHINIWPLSHRDIINAIKIEIAEKDNLKINDKAINIIAEKSHGNMSQASQLIQLLSDQKEPVFDEINILDFLIQSSKYDVFELIDSMACKNINSVNILNYLLKNQTENILVLWAMTKFIKTLYELKVSHSAKEQAQVFAKNKIWQSKQSLYLDFKDKISIQKISSYINTCHELDLSIKGSKSEDTTIMFNQLLLDIINS